MSTDRADIRTQVTDRVIAALEAGTAPWRKAWNVSGGGLPRSLSTGKAYRGMNVFLLAMAGYTSPFWGTYRAITENGGQVRKGERATQVILWKRFSKDAVNPDTGEREEKAFMVLRSYSVFNVEQADNLPEKFYPAKDAGSAEIVQEHAEASAIAKEYFGREGAPSLSYGGSKAYYRPSTDHVQIPNAIDFDSDEDFQDTRFHEMVHSTAKRTGRKTDGDFDHFGSAKYGKEELVAEMGAAMLMATCGIESTFDNSAAYLASWLKTIKGDNTLVISAGAAAQKAMDCILGTVFEDE